MSKFIHVTRKSLPIIVLGLIRVILLKGIDYPVSFIPVESLFLMKRKRNTDDTGIFHHFCTSYRSGFTSSRSFALSHSSRWSYRWSEYEGNLTRVLNDIPLRSRTRLSSWSWRLSTFFTSRRFSDQCKQGRDYFPYQVKGTRNANISNPKFFF